MSTRRLRPFFLSRTSLVETERLRALAAAAEPLRAAAKRCSWARSVQPGTVQVNIMSMVPFFSLLKHSEMLRNQGLVASHLCGASAERDSACIEDHDLVGDVEGELDVLLDQENRLAFLLEASDGAS